MAKKAKKAAKKAVKKASKTSKASGLVSGASALASRVLPGVGAVSSAKGGYRRSRKKGPNWWANRVLVEKLKKRYYKLKYGSMR